MVHLFTYGTLMDAGIMEGVSGDVYRSEKAILHGFLRRTVQDEVFPAIIKKDGCSVEGVIYFDVSKESFARLDVFEGSLYQRKKVMVIADDGREVAVSTYVIAPDCVNLLSSADWSYEDFLKQGKVRFTSRYQGFDRLD